MMKARLNEMFIGGHTFNKVFKVCAKVFAKTLAAAACLVMALSLSSCAGIERNRTQTYHPLYDLMNIPEDWRKDNNIKFSAADEDLAAFKTAVIDGDLTLLYSEKTAEIAVVRSDGAVWRSNPEGRFANKAQESVSAQVHLTTYSNDNAVKTWNTFTDSVKYGQFRFEPVPNGIKAIYTIGRAKIKYNVPRAFLVPRFEEEILPLVTSAADITLMKKVYYLVDLNRRDESELGMNTAAREAMLEEYPALAYGPMYIIQSSNKLELNKVEKILNGIGYTPDDLAMDEEAAAGGTEVGASERHIELPVEYTLVNGELRVEVKVDEIKATATFDEKTGAVTDELKVASIALLRYFGSPGHSLSGYGLVPDESGAVIDFSKKLSSAFDVYRERVYGYDFANILSERSSAFPRLYLPAFGVSNGQSATLGIISNGAEIAYIEADAPRSNGSVPYVCASFTLLDNASLSLSGASSSASSDSGIRVIPKQLAAHNISVTYTFAKLDAGYDDLAVALRERMLSDGLLEAKSTDATPATTVKLTGAIDKKELFLGVPVTKVLPLTTFKAADEIASRLSQSLDGRLNIILDGWLTGGVRTTAQNTLKPESVLGGLNGFKSLAAKLDSLGVGFYPAIDPQYVYRDKAFDGFNTFSDAVTLLSGIVGFKPDYSPVNFRYTKNGLTAYLVKPSSAIDYAKRITTALKNLDIAGAALPHIGEDLYSDYKREAYVSRTDAAAATTADFVTHGMDYAIKGSNSYALPFAAMLYDLPVSGRYHQLFARNVPMLQIVLSGCVDYTASAMNYEEDIDLYILKCIETGSSVYAELFAADAASVKRTDFAFMYSNSLTEWQSELIAAANQVTSALEQTSGGIVSHKTEDDLVIVSWENGVTIALNYGQTAVSFRGNIIRPKGYVIIH